MTLRSRVRAARGKQTEKRWTVKVKEEEEVSESDKTRGQVVHNWLVAIYIS
jgi:hypothetical protein